MSLLDPSTVSRHVAQLARAGYVQRRPDPQDGRAVQLVATDAGAPSPQEIGAPAPGAVVSALADWAPDDLATLVTLLVRLNDDLDAFRPHLGAGDRRPDAPPARAAAPAAPGRHLPDPRTPDQESA